MENHRELFDLKDPFLERMIHKLPIDQTSDGFTFNLMNQIYARVEAPIEPSLYRRQMLWAYGSIGAGLIIIALIIFSIWPLINFEFALNTSSILQFISTALTVLDKFATVFEWLSNKTIELSILFSILTLFVVERLLRKGVSNSGTYLL